MSITNPKSKLTAFLLGMLEFRLSFTWADPARPDGPDDYPYTDLDEAYDRGRDMAHRLTLRYFEEV